MRCVLLAVFLLVTCVTGAGAVPADDAISADQRGDYVMAARLFRHLANQGNADAQSILGWMYVKGEGVAQDLQEGAKWYRKAAKQGHAKSQLVLGLMFATGQGVPQ